MSSLIEQALQSFKQGTKEGVAPILRVDYLSKSVRLYREALHSDFSLSYVDRIALLKNIGTINSKIPSNLHPSEVEKRIYYIIEALEHLTSAKELARSHNLSHGVVAWDYNWFNKVNEHMEYALGVAHETCNSLSTSQRLKWLSKLLEPMKKTPRFRSEHLNQLSTIVLNAAIQHSERREFDVASNLLEDYSHLFIDAETFSKKALTDYEAENEPPSHLVTEAEDLMERRFLLLCVCQSVRTRLTADSLLEKLLQDDVFNFEMIWNIVDHFRQAILLTREKDIEHEALCLSRLGRIFEKVVKVRSKARECYRSSIELALSLTPRNMSGVDWYEEAQEALQKIQQEEMLRDDKVKEEARQVYREEYKEVLIALDTVSRQSAFKLLEHLYKMHPPSNPNHTLETPTADNLKKVLLRAIVHYHPDKQDQEDVKWHFLCEEITKRLNVHYGTFKH